MSVSGRKTPSVLGSRYSVYSHASTGRTAARSVAFRSSRLQKIPWYKKPLVKSAGYTDLQTGSWHIGFYTLVLSFWTIFTSCFDIYCLHEAMPGSSHTGYYIISFDFVYVGNYDVRNILFTSSVFSLAGGVALFVVSSLLLDGLRREQETAFSGWLWTMGIFTPWKIISWAFAGIVNDIIFAYNIVMLVVWFVLNILNVLSFICIYSLYLELEGLTKIQDLARLKVDTMSVPMSRRASAFGGSRSLTPYSGHPLQQISPLPRQEEEFEINEELLNKHSRV